LQWVQRSLGVRKPSQFEHSIAVCVFVGANEQNKGYSLIWKFESSRSASAFSF